MASARLRIVLDQPSPAARPGTRYAWQLWHTPDTAKLHNAALPSVSASQSQAPFVAATASRPSGEGNGPLCKIAYAGAVAQPSALPVRFAPYAPPSARPFGLSWHRGISQALRALFWSAASPCILCLPPPTLVLRRCAASALRAGLPVRPPRGLPQPARLCLWFCYKFSSWLRKEYGGYRPKRPVSQRDRWLTSQVQWWLFLLCN